MGSSKLEPIGRIQSLNFKRSKMLRFDGCTSLGVGA